MGFLALVFGLGWLPGCGPDANISPEPSDAAVELLDGGGGPADGGAEEKAPDPFADRVVSFLPGPSSGFGQDLLPQVVLGPPEGGGSIGSFHVLSLGKEGSIVLEFTDLGIIDGPGPDLLVFENPFPGWTETGIVAVSEDGQSWFEFPCAPTASDAGFSGCAGVGPVHASSSNGVDPTDPLAAGGDAFDLATVGLLRARFVRIRDSGHNAYGGTSGGFDLDAVAVVNGSLLSSWPR